MESGREHAQDLDRVIRVDFMHRLCSGYLRRPSGRRQPAVDAHSLSSPGHRRRSQEPGIEEGFQHRSAPPG